MFAVGDWVSAVSVSKPFPMAWHPSLKPEKIYMVTGVFCTPNTERVLLSIADPFMYLITGKPMEERFYAIRFKKVE